MSATDLKAVSILIVEDEPLLRRQLAATLERFGADVAAADSVAATRQRLGDGHFDFVLLDVNLPDGLGTDLLREKAFPPATAIIVMTAHGGVASAVEAMRLGATDYLVKPFDPGDCLWSCPGATRAQKRQSRMNSSAATRPRRRRFLFWERAGGSGRAIEERFWRRTRGWKLICRPCLSKAKRAPAKQPLRDGFISGAARRAAFCRSELFGCGRIAGRIGVVRTRTRRFYGRANGADWAL